MRRAILAALAATMAIGLLGADAQAATRKISALPVTFDVRNVNTSKLACATDGASYQIKGHIVGPRSALAGASARKRKRTGVTLYLHGLGFGEWFWRFTAVPTFDYAAAQARTGHTSVVIDRLGYDTSGHPAGKSSCLGGQADIAHQVVQALRSGKYAVTGGRAKRFRRVALAGHSAGGGIAMLEAYSFRDVDALAVMSFSYANLPRAQLALGPTRDACLAGGVPAEAGLPSGYAFYGKDDPADFQSIMFHGASAAVLGAATPLRNRDPCGDIDSIIPALLQQTTALRQITVPVLVICGTRDALYSSLGCGQEEAKFTRSRRTKLELVRNAGHAVTLDPPARTFRRKVSRWLSRYGF
jgi:pimeloyl-ACP methyl ester carboxylesterase